MGGLGQGSSPALSVTCIMKMLIIAKTLFLPPTPCPKASGLLHGGSRNRISGWRRVPSSSTLVGQVIGSSGSELESQAASEWSPLGRPETS